MPVYTYKCDTCGHQFDIRQRFADDPLTKCPQCENEIRRVITQVGVVFKGSGFYVTDNRNGRSNGQVNGKGKSQSEKTSETKSESGKSPAGNTVANKKESESVTAGSAAS